MSQSFSPRIYVACLASYNNGVLHGVWIDANQNVENVRDEIAAMLRDSKFPNVKVDCPACRGMGSVSFGTDLVTCGDCHGAGEVPSAEEYAIHDYDDFGGAKLGEHESLETVVTVAEMLEKHGDAFIAYCDNQGDYNVSEDAFEEAYRGRWDSVQAFAEDYIEQTGTLDKVPETLKNYFDYEAFARDLELGGDIWTAEASEGGVHVFDNH
jgi:antirestriction protein